MSTKKRLFDQITADSKATTKELNLKLTERSIKRNFQSASDDLSAQQDQAQIKYNNALANLDRFDVNAIINYKQAIKDADATKAILNETYADLFSEDLA